MKGVVEMKFSKSYLDQLLDKVNTGEEVDITGMGSQESLILKTKEDSEGNEYLSIKITIKKNRRPLTPISLNLYVENELVDSRLFFEDEDQNIINTIKNWFI